MNPIAARVAKLIAPVIGDMGFEFVGVEYGEHGGGRNSGGLLRVYIDRENDSENDGENGVSLSDCESVSHRVSGLLDVEEIIAGRYALEVSSPGADRPLFNEEHYRRFISRRVKVVMAVPQSGRRRFAGVLLGCDDGHIIMEVAGEARKLPFAQVAGARLIPEIPRSTLKK